jgi:hypothetical protein
MIKTTYMRLHIHLPFLVLTSLLLLSSCEKPVDFNNIQTEQELVVISNFTNNRALQVVVTTTRSAFSTDSEESPYVTNAQVDLHLDDGTFVESLAFIQPKSEEDVPYYSTYSFIPQPNEFYTLKVSAPGYKTISARSRIPSPIELIDVVMNNLRKQAALSGSEVDITYDLDITFQDPSEEENFYHISLVQELEEFQVLGGDTTSIGIREEYLLFDPRENTQQQVAHLGGGILLEDSHFNGKAYSLNLPVRFSYDASRYTLGQLIVELRVVSEEYYRYFSSLSRQYTSKGEPFSEPVVIFDNVEGGQGVFAGYSGSRDSLFLNR